MPKTATARPTPANTVASFPAVRRTQLPRLLEMMAAYYEEDGLDFDPARARAAVLGLLRKPAWGRIWFICQGSNVVGYAVLTLGYSIEFGGHDAFVDELYVEEAHRGAGFGFQALEHMAQQARRLGVRQLHLQVQQLNERARRLYLRNGYADHNRHLMSRSL